MIRSLGAYVMAAVGLVSVGSAQEVPFLSGRVNDYAGILSSQTVVDLENQLRDHESKTSNQVALLTVSSLEGGSLEEFSLRVAESWKLGQKEKDNGALLLIAKEDRKLRIEVGDGLEGVLTDARSSQIIRHEIVPHFKNGDYDAGVRAGVTAILQTIDGTYVREESDAGFQDGFESFGEKVLGLGIFTFVVGIFTLIALVQKGGMGWFLYAFLIPFWLVFPLAILGTIIPFVIYVVGFPILKLLLAQNPAFRKWGDRWAASSGGSGWTSSGGWSSGGGGFSGGGGSFSGGGSSGSW